MTSLKLNYVALTDVGLRRSTNQDSGYASSRLIAVADGMGGAAAGDLASAEAMNVIRQLDRDLGDIDPLEAMQRAVAHANHRLGELVRENPAVEGMGTTVEAMLWDGQRFATAHLGDSRAYLLRDGELIQISTDHTFVQSLVEEGKLTPAEARVHPHRSLLLRVMLGRDDNDPDLGWFEGQLGDRYLLCSDGLSDMVDDAVIAEALASETIDLAASELVRLALENGGYDNVTVVLGELVDASTEPDEHLSSSDGQPQLVGAAAEGPRPRTGQASSGTGAVHTEESRVVDLDDIDPEELRYAPRPPSKWRWLRRFVALVLVLAVLAGAAVYGYRWTQGQYYVAESDGKVTIYRGVPAELPLIKLQHIDEVTDIDLTTLPEFRAEQVREGLEADSRANAEQIVEDLRALVTKPPADDEDADKKDGDKKKDADPSPSPSATTSGDSEERGT